MERKRKAQLVASKDGKLIITEEQQHTEPWKYNLNLEITRYLKLLGNLTKSKFSILN